MKYENFMFSISAKFSDGFTAADDKFHIWFDTKTNDGKSKLLFFEPTIKL